MTLSSDNLPDSFRRAMVREPALKIPLAVAIGERLAEKRAKPASDEPMSPTKAPMSPETPKAAQKPSKPKKRRGAMNRTEARYAAVLDLCQKQGEILSYRFEGVRLTWGMDEKTGEAMRYCPDFFVTTHNMDGPERVVGHHFQCIEVKGARIRDRDIVRFKGCRAEWEEFEFIMVQWKNGEWNRLY